MSWPLVKLGNIVDIKGGGTPSKSNPEFWGGNIPWASVKDFKSSSLKETADYITKLGVEKSATNVIPAGNVIVPTRMALGKVAINEVDMAINQDLKALLVNDEKTLSKLYLMRFLESKAAFIDEQGKGATVKGITLDVLRNLEIPLPPLPEQKRIAAILDKADAIRRKRQQAIQLADDFLRAVFLDMFGDPVTNPKGWEVRLSGELFSVPPRIGTTTPADGQGSLVVRVGEIGKQDINFSKCGRAQLKDSELERFILHSGDTVLARAIGSKNQLGKASFFSGYSENVYIDSHVMRLRPNVKVCNPEWFYRFISSDGGKSLLQKAGGETAVQFNINAKQAASLLIPLPPIELQNEFVDFCQKHSKSKTHLSKQAGDVEMLFSSLSQKAFSGQL